MANPVAQYYIDGADLYLVYGIFISAGSDDLLKIPKRKESITHDWLDENGVDVDLSRVFLESRDITLECNFLANSKDDFWYKYNSFIATLTKPGLRRLELSEFGKSYYVYYKECSSWKRFARINSGPEKGRIACKFTITFTEKNPTIDASNVYIITDDNRFMIT